jgi:hypothetical protein
MVFKKMVVILLLSSAALLLFVACGGTGAPGGTKMRGESMHPDLQAMGKGKKPCQR